MQAAVNEPRILLWFRLRPTPAPAPAPTPARLGVYTWRKLNFNNSNVQLSNQVMQLIYDLLFFRASPAWPQADKGEHEPSPVRYDGRQHCEQISPVF